ncbi:Uncharacterized protein related to capsule biosynthesis enzymes [Providencia rustigianii]|uniref:HipA domain protein n=2 Tax=Providencia rustigianii TaxID=158850 RepID=D1NZB1_9GAMM|nr:MULTISPECIES: HipA N-terminal domain-containing protein [Providencia]EFB73809.1 HipA domain protein [Providencia rustigianii DSM 4541]MTC57332.1 type II toxin-antitoxin system HipA family toxin [Providencia rustigianii]MTC60904.1 type II toxin-antitoxin system HipA family toxin [Providencia rustigianii]SUC26843.1 Uncharacterized protein related to capsule biosynthesis enzymes [Providencia rustigianii]SUC35447.1 Uncharacterized protein related to capsule biosynthesis enzymes [Providencia rus
MSRKVEVWLYNIPVGILAEVTNGYSFQYYQHYDGQSVSLSMGVRSEPYLCDELHPFFKGLAPEGWLKKRYSELQKIDPNDLFGMLIQNGNDLLGAITFKEIAHE